MAEIEENVFGMRFTRAFYPLTVGAFKILNHVQLYPYPESAEKDVS